MNRYSNKALIIGLFLVMFAGCKSDEPTTATSPQPDTTSSATAATDTTAVATAPNAAVATNSNAAAKAPAPLFAPVGHPIAQPVKQQPVTQFVAQPNTSGKRASQEPVEVGNVESQFVMNGRGWYVLGEIKNSSGKLLRKVELTTSLLDDKGKSVAEQTDDLPPSLVPSQDGERKKFSINVKPPPGWQGKAVVKVTHAEF